jgi:hypothetical protein
LGLIRLEFGDWEDKVAAMSQSVVKMPSVGKPKLLDQRVKALLTRQRDIQLMHYVYVIRSVSDDGFYIGYSSNL